MTNQNQKKRAIDLPSIIIAAVAALLIISGIYLLSGNIRDGEDSTVESSVAKTDSDNSSSQSDNSADQKEEVLIEEEDEVTNSEDGDQSANESESDEVVEEEVPEEEFETTTRVVVEQEEESEPVADDAEEVVVEDAFVTPEPEEVVVETPAPTVTNSGLAIGTTSAGFVGTVLGYENGFIKLSVDDSGFTNTRWVQANPGVHVLLAPSLFPNQGEGTRYSINMNISNSQQDGGFEVYGVNSVVQL